jgi:hypothetical protein
MNWKAFLLIGVVGVVIGGGYAWNEYTRAKATANDLPVKESISATELLAAFSADEAAASTRFVGATEQVVQVNGTIRSVDMAGGGITNVVLETGDAMAGIVCEFSSSTVPSTWKTGDAVAVKGICTGMLMDVVLVRCVPAL